MNVPFPPAFLWLLLPLLVWACRRWRRRAIETVMRRIEAQAAETPPDTPSRITGKDAAWMSCHWVILGAVLVLYLALQLALFSAPPLRGRITDRDTGAPVAGARVWRVLYATMGFQLVESPSAAALSSQTITTRDDDTFSLPGFVNLLPAGFNGLSGFGWVVTHADYVPILDCQQRGFFPIGGYSKGCGYFGDALAPWARATWKTGIRSAKLELAVRRASTQEAAAATIRRMAVPLRYRAVDPAEVVTAATAYVARWPLNDELAQETFGIEEAVLESASRNDDRLGFEDARRSFTVVEGYCKANPQSEFCQKKKGLMRFTPSFLARHDRRL